MVPVRVTFVPCDSTPFTLSLVDGLARRLSRSVVHAAPDGPDFVDSLAGAGVAALPGLVLWVGFAAGAGVALELAEADGVGVVVSDALVGFSVGALWCAGSPASVRFADEDGDGLTWCVDLLCSAGVTSAESLRDVAASAGWAVGVVVGLTLCFLLSLAAELWGLRSWCDASVLACFLAWGGSAVRPEVDR